MKEEKVGISVLDLFKKVVAKLVLDLRGKKICFPARIEAEIANDSDWHRNRVGYIGYDEAFLVKVQDKQMVIALGEKCGQYPGDQYCCDLVVAFVLAKSKMPKDIKSSVREILSSNTYFHSSTMVAMADGRFGVRQGSPYLAQINAAISARILSDYTARDLEVDRDLLTMNLQPVVKAGVLYKEEFVDILADILKKVVMV